MNTRQPDSANSEPRPTALVLTEDIWSSTRLADVLRELGFQPEVVEKPADLGAQGDSIQRDIPLTEPLEGPDAEFMRALTERRPALLLVDLTAEALPWRRWLHTIKTSAATRRIPVIAFGPHVKKDVLEAARQANADVVVSRGELQARLPELVREYAREVDPQAMLEACSRGLSDEAQFGIELHNQGEYFEAHEELEHAWMAEEDEAGFLYRALLQVTVAYLHVQRGNFRGASKMLLRVRQWLDPLPDRCRGVDVETLRTQVEELRAAVADAGPEGLDELDRSLFRPFPMVEDPPPT